MKSTKYYDPDPMNAEYVRCCECGGEVYEYGEMYTWTRRVCGEWEIVLICPDCLEEHFNDLPLDEKAELIGSERVIVGNNAGEE